MSWVCIPYTCLQDALEECSQTEYLDTLQLELLKSKNIPGKFYSKDNLTGFYQSFQFGMMLERSDRTTLKPLNFSNEQYLLTDNSSLPVVSPAKTSPVPGKAKVLMEKNLDFGNKWQELSVKYNPGTSSWKTHRCLFQEDLPESSVTLPKLGMMLDGVLYQRKMSELPIKGTGSGWLPTPSACSYGSNKGGAAGRVGKMRHSLETMARKDSWPTPTAQDGNGRTYYNQRDGSKVLSLLGRVQEKTTFPTPTSSMATVGDMEQARFAGNDSRRPSYKEANQTTVEGSLNPDWVELLLGWPKGWTSLEPLNHINDDWYTWPKDWERNTPRVTNEKNNRPKRLKAIGNGQVSLCAAIAWIFIAGDKQGR